MVGIVIFTESIFILGETCYPTDAAFVGTKYANDRRWRRKILGFLVVRQGKRPMRKVSLSSPTHLFVSLSEY